MCRCFAYIFLFCFCAHSFEIAVTVDDLPAANTIADSQTRTEVAAEFMAAAKKHKIPKMYGFMVGSLVQDMPERSAILKSWKQAGHFLGNHTYSHLDLVNVSAPNFIADIEKNESLLIDSVDSIDELKVFRFPFLQEGETNEKRYAIRSYLKKRNYLVAQVTVDFEDWAFNDAFVRCMTKKNEDQMKEIEDRYLRHAVDRLRYSLDLSKRIWGDKKNVPHILLIHLNPVSARIADRLFTAFKAEGAEFTAADRLIKHDFFTEDTTYTGPAGKTYLLQAKESRKLNWFNLLAPVTPKKWLDERCH